MIQFPGQISGSCLNATRQVAWDPSTQAFYMKAFFVVKERAYAYFQGFIE